MMSTENNKQQEEKLLLSLEDQITNIAEPESIPEQPPIQVVSGGSTSNIGPDGVIEIYKTNDKAKAKPFYLDIDNPDSNNKVFATTYGSKIYKFEKSMTEGKIKFARNKGAPQSYASGAPPGKSCRFHISAGGNISTPGKKSWKDKPTPDYVTASDVCFYSHEMTAIARVGKALGTHQSFAFKVNSRPDKPDDTLRSTIEFCMPNDQKKSAYVNYNYAHAGYANTTGVKEATKDGKITVGQWIGVKYVHLISADRKSTLMQLYVNTNPIKTEDGTPNNDGWKLKSEYTATGIKQYPVPPVWGGDSYLRIDGYEYVDLFRFSQREVLNQKNDGKPDPGPNPPPNPGPNPPPPPVPKPEPPGPIDPPIVQTDLIYQGTGKRLTADLGVLEAKNPWPMQSGAKRPSARFIWGAGKGKGDAKCVAYHSLEATIYAKIGAKVAKSPSMALLIQSGGPGQHGQNGCTYNLGFGEDGVPVSGEECQHDPKVKGGKIPGSITSTKIGPLENKIIGMKWIMTHPSANLVHVEGWVDADNSGKWKLFYKADNPHGSNEKEIPIITKVPMFGTDTCQEVRMRCDGYWPFEIVKEKSFVAELPDNPKPTSDFVNKAIASTQGVTALTATDAEIDLDPAIEDQ